MNWYVVNTHSGSENKAKLALEDAIQRAGLEHLGHRGDTLFVEPVDEGMHEAIDEDRRGGRGVRDDAA